MFLQVLGVEVFCLRYRVWKVTFNLFGTRRRMELSFMCEHFRCRVLMVRRCCRGIAWRVLGWAVVLATSPLGEVSAVCTLRILE